LHGLAVGVGGWALLAAAHAALTVLVFYEGLDFHFLVGDEVKVFK
jgi:hypothetical protein